MLKIGDYNNLIVEKEVEFGMYLLTDGDSILLPKKYVPKGTKPGDAIDVFIYADSEDRLIATNLIPKAVVGDFAPLVAKDINKYGAFMDWGLEKDLIVPFNEQGKRMEPGKTYVVKVLLDPKSNRILGSTKLSAFFEKKNIELEEGEEVQLLIYDKSELAFSAIINNRYSGILYINEVFKRIDIGDKIIGYVKQLRPDNKIDLTLNKTGKELTDNAKEIILEKLKENQGFLPLTDDSSPEAVKAKLQISKKAFKKAVGGLYKTKVIKLTPEGIYLI